MPREKHIWKNNRTVDGSRAISSIEMHTQKPLKLSSRQNLETERKGLVSTSHRKVAAFVKARSYES